MGRFGRGGFVFFLVVIAVLLWIIVIPLGQMILSSFRAGHPAAPGPFTFDNYLVAYGSPLTYVTIFNTFLFAAGGTVFSVGFALLFAWFVERTDMPLRNLCWTLLLIPLAMPGVLFAMSYVFLFSPKSGIMNLFLRSLLGPLGIDLSEGPINIYSLGGMMFLDGVRGVTGVFLLIVGAFRMMDPSLEEASLSAGASTWTTARRVTLPVLLPAVLAAVLYSFTSSMESLEVPLLIGVPARVFVYSTLIYYSAQGPIANYGIGGAFAVSYFLMALFLVYFYQRATIAQAERFATVTGKAYRPGTMALGRWRYAALGLFLIYFCCAVLLPIGVLIWVSLLPYYELPSWQSLSKISLKNYWTVLSQPAVLRSAWNTLVITLVTATGTVMLASAVSWLVVRTKLKWRFALDGLTFASHAIPGVVIALSLILLYLHPFFRPLGLYGTAWIVSAALMTQYIAFATRSINAAVSQVHREVEEAGETSGASQLRILRQITFPLIRPAVIASWIWVAAHALRSFAIPVMLASRENQTLSVILWRIWDDDRNLPAAAAFGVLFALGLSLMTFWGRTMIVKGFRQG